MTAHVVVDVKKVGPGSPEPPGAIEVNRPYLLAQLLHERAAAARARAGRATKTMIAGHDFALLKRIRIDVPQKDRLSIVPLHSELLVEIAVIHFATPADADRVAAHEPIDRGRIKIVDQELHVFLKLVVVPQI